MKQRQTEQTYITDGFQDDFSGLQDDVNSIQNELSGFSEFIEDADDEFETIAYALTDLNSRISGETNDRISADTALAASISGLGETMHYLTNVTGAAGGTNLSASWSGSNSDVTSLYTGLNVQIKVPNNGHTSGVTLSVNGGDKHVVLLNAATKVTTQYPTGSILTLTYDADESAVYYSGSSTSVTAQGVWKLSDYNTNTTYTVVDNTYPKYSSFKAATTIYRYQILVHKDEDTLLPMNTVSNSTGTSKTLTTKSFDPFGGIYYYNVTATTNSGSTIATGRTFQQILADLRYSFNTSSSLTASRSVYLVTVPQGDGLVKLADNPISQDLPTTDDGKVYIYLGCAYDTYRVALEMPHPAYCYKITTKSSIVDGILVKCKDFLGLTNTGTNSGLSIIRLKSDDVSDCYWHTTNKTFVKFVNESTYSTVGFTDRGSGDIFNALSGVPYVYNCTKYLYNGTDLVASGQADCYCEGHLMLYTSDSSGDRIDVIENAIMQLQYDTNDEISALSSKIDRFSEIISAALNDLNNRVVENRNDINDLLNA